jgi:hypothetical protein
MRGAVVGEIGSQKSLTELLGDLTDGGAQLMRDELRLARAETLESLLRLRRGAVLLGIGVGLALCATAAGVSGLIMVVSLYLLDGRTWLSALIVAVLLGIVGWICVRRGGNTLSASSLAPHETATSIKETAEWLKHPARSALR